MGLYTALPGLTRWHEPSVPLLAPCLPAVGLVLGGVWYGLSTLLWSRTPPLLGAVGLSLTVPLLTGFMHLDGFMDVSDALLSGREREEKLRILKDPHAGAFSVIALVCLLLFQTAAAHAALSRRGSLAPLWLLPVISRALAGLSLMSLAPLSQSSYGKMAYTSATGALRAFCAGALVLSLLFSPLLGWRAAAACALAALGFAAPCALAVRSLGGMNGDVAGWSICIAELCGLIALGCL